MSRAPRFAAITTVTFDAGGTLLQPHPSVGAVYADAARRHGTELDPAAVDAAFRRAFGLVSKSSIQLDPEARERDFWRRVVAATLADTAAVLPDFTAYFDDVWEVFSHGDQWRLLPDARPTLTTLRARGYHLAVLSNWDRRLHRVLEETRLRPLFDHILISSEVGAEKPDPEIFRAAERACAAAPEQCLHIGDSRRHDLAGAQGAGWSALLVSLNCTPTEPEHHIDGLADLLDLLPGRDAGATSSPAASGASRP